MIQKNSRKKTRTPSLLDLFQNNVATVTELRVGIFAPITQITARSKTYKDFVKNGRERKLASPWGDVIVRGNILTQIHRDILDAIFTQNKEVKTTPNGNIAVFFSGYEIQSFLGKKSLTNNTWLKKKLNEIKTTNIEFKDGQGNEYDFNITDSGGYSVKQDSFVIVFTEAYMNFFGKQTTVDYKDEIKKLLEVHDPLVKAIIRFFFTHANDMSIDLDKLLSSLGYPDGDRPKKEARSTLRASTDKLIEFGITVDLKKNIIHYAKSHNVTHSVPQAIQKTIN